MEALSNLEKRVLLAFQGHADHATPDQVQQRSGLEDMVHVMNGSSWLQAKGLVRHEETLHVTITIDEKGREAILRTLPERRLLNVLANAGGTAADWRDLAKGHLTNEELNLAIGWCKRKGLANMKKEGDANVLSLTEYGWEVARGRKTPDEAVLDDLFYGGEKNERELNPDGLKLLLQRQDLVHRREEIQRVIHVTAKGRKLLAQGVVVKDEVNDLTSDLIGSGKWRDAAIRPYDVKAFAPVATGGKKHPLRQIIDRIRSVFLEMGFTEIEGPYVRSAFWNMDALFTPQDHPAREMQDTFYLTTPGRATLDDDLVAKVQAVHERGGDTGSRGWRNPWSRRIAEQMLLRTHTTVDTIEYLARHPAPPVKVFSVDRVFRNEALDATHLPEFHQVEGIVMEEGANLRQLIGLLREFYAKMGFEKLRVRPAYFPYTEPSLEIEVHYNGRWMELGGAGIFRPEVTKPVGVDHPVLAWGLGLERLAMMSLQLKDIRELYVSDIEWLRNEPLK